MCHADLRLCERNESASETMRAGDSRTASTGHARCGGCTLCPERQTCAETRLSPHQRVGLLAVGAFVVSDRPVHLRPCRHDCDGLWHCVPASASVRCAGLQARCSPAHAARCLQAPGWRSVHMHSRALAGSGGKGDDWMFTTRSSSRRLQRTTPAVHCRVRSIPESVCSGHAHARGGLVAVLAVNSSTSDDSSCPHVAPHSCDPAEHAGHDTHLQTIPFSKGGHASSLVHGAAHAWPRLQACCTGRAQIWRRRT